MALFRRIVVTALLAGLAGGIALSLTQRLQVIPIISQAEILESQKVAPAGQTQDSQDSDHDHDHDAWGPEDGLERVFFTALSNVLTAIGFALLLVSLSMAASMGAGKPALQPSSGMIWGFGGFLVFFLAPSVGIQPQLPGVEGAAFAHRQLWWIATVVCTAAGLFGAYVLKTNWRWLGAIVFITVPHVMGAPRATASFAGHTTETATQLAKLSSDFLIATGASSLVMWLVLGATAGLIIKRTSDA
ncbi:MAG: CbtA family protein [Gammaproteobacteria bacterium]